MLHDMIIRYRYGALAADKDGEGKRKLGQWNNHTASKSLRRTSFRSNLFKKRGLFTSWQRLLTSKEKESSLYDIGDGGSSIISGAVAICFN